MRKLSRRSLMTGGAVTLAAAGAGTYTIYRLFAQTAAASVMSPPEGLDAVRQGDGLLVDVRQPDVRRLSFARVDARWLTFSGFLKNKQSN